MENEKRLVNRADLARMLSVSTDTIQRWERAGTIPMIRCSKQVVRYDPAAVVAALEAQSAAK